MPRRPTQHQQEDKSRAKFRLLIPDAWVFRDVTPDYGIDGEVEIFDIEGRSTALSFLVQLKSTRDKLKSRRRRVRFTKKQVCYYRDRQPPVLIVRYDEIEDQFYVRWAGRVDSYYSKDGSKTISIKFSEEENWTAQTSDQLVDDLKRLQNVNRGNIKLPITAKLTIGSQILNLVPRQVLQSNLRACLSSGGDKFISFVAPSETDFDLEIVLGYNELSVHIGCSTGCSVHGDFTTAEAFGTTFLGTVLASVAVTYSYLGQNGMASRLILDAFAFPLNELPSRLSLHLIKALMISGHFERAIEVGKSCFLDPNEWDLELTFQIGVRKFGAELPNHRRQAVTDYLFNRLSRAKETGIKQLIGIAHYNLGNHFRSTKQGSRAVFHYKKAANYSSKYVDKSYFLMELAGVLFNGGHFTMATRFYERAIATANNSSEEEKSRLEFLYADSLMFSGRYEKALELFDRIASTDESNKAECVLKAFILNHLVNVAGVKEQARQAFEATHKVIWDPKACFETRVESYAEAFKLDNLCVLAWVNYGFAYSRLGLETDNERWIDAYAGFLAGALLQTNDIESWVNAILCAINHKVLWGHIPLICEVAYFANGNAFLEAANSKMLKQIPIEEASGVLDLIHQSSEASSLKRKNSTTFRILDHVGDVVVETELD